tara:strand:- start:10871 stop:11977 length:1107 start_codon:yes stop_codon:yes gene_type:complete
MKKYKLIKEYPESQKEGTVFVAHNEINAVFQAEGGGAVIYWNTIEKYSEYFEEVKEEKKCSNLNVKEVTKEELNELIKLADEPNYLITAFRSIEDKDSRFDNRIVKIESNGKYARMFTCDEMLKNPPCVESGDFEIYSVKNSKGEEFTIGDKVYFENFEMKGDVFVIDNFFINKADVVLARNGANRYDIGENIRSINKVKTPIYTTTDGGHVYKGERHNGLYLLNKDLTLPQDPSARVVYSFNILDVEVCKRYLTFTSEENRDKYIKENTRKPVFTSTDGKEYFKEDEGKKEIWHNNNWIANWRYFKISSLHPDTEYYSTADACNEYIDNNKPKYSLADIEKVLNGIIISFKHTTKESVINGLKKLGK